MTDPKQAKDSEWAKEMVEKFKIWGLDWPWANYVRDLIAQAVQEKEVEVLRVIADAPRGEAHNIAVRRLEALTHK